MNKINISDVVKNNIIKKSQLNVDIGASGFEIRANICGIINKFTNTADIHMQYTIAKTPTTRGETSYETINLENIANVFDAKMINIDGEMTRVSILYLPTNTSSNLTISDVYGKSGLILVPVWNNKVYGNIARLFGTASTDLGNIPFSWRIWDVGVIAEVDIFNAELQY